MKSKSYKSDHAFEILTKLNDDRIKMKNYCDVTLTAQSNDFAGHKCVLGVFSTFFSKMFSIEMKEKYERKGNVQGVNEETLEAVLSFIYTCDITITSVNVYNLIEAANYMEIPHLKEFCVEFLLEEIDATNCLDIRTYSKFYNLDKVGEKANSVITNQFKSLIKEKEFNKLKFEDIKEIFELEDKKVTSEEIAFNGMMQWIKHDVDARRQHLTELFSLLKLDTFTKRFLQNVVCQEELVMNTSECIRMCLKSTVSRISDPQSMKTVPEQQRAESRCLAFARNQVWKYNVTKNVVINLPNTKFDHYCGSVVRHNDRVYVISGSDTNAVESFDLENQVSGWTELTSTNLNRGSGASVVFDGRIYSFGGNGFCSSQSGECYNIDENRWNRIDDMNEGRYDFALVSTNRGIYAIGGYNNDALKTVEYHDPRQGGWKMIPSMNVARVGLAGVVLNDQLYAIGGDNEELKTVECHIPLLGGWNTVHPRVRVAGGILDDQLYARGGGCNHKNQLPKSVERFDPRNQTWCNVAEMGYARSNHGACVSNGKIYVTGGGSNAVEVYDPEMNFWQVKNSGQDFRDIQFMVTI